MINRRTFECKLNDNLSAVGDAIVEIIVFFWLEIFWITTHRCHWKVIGSEFVMWNRTRFSSEKKLFSLDGHPQVSHDDPFDHLSKSKRLRRCCAWSICCLWMFSDVYEFKITQRLYLSNSAKNYALKSEAER